MIVQLPGQALQKNNSSMASLAVKKIIEKYAPQNLSDKCDQEAKKNTLVHHESA